MLFMYELQKVCLTPIMVILVREWRSFALFGFRLFCLHEVVVFIHEVQQHEAVVCRRAVFDRRELEPLSGWDESPWEAASLRVDALCILFGDTSGQGEHKDGTCRILNLA